MSAAFFRGTSSAQDTRFADKEKKLLQSTKFPKEFSCKLDVKRVDLDVVRRWVNTRITQLLGFDDEVLSNLVMEYLNEEKPDPKIMLINLKEFLDKDTNRFMKDLWVLLLSAQEHPSGIPRQMLEKKKEELAKREIGEKFKQDQDEIKLEDDIKDDPGDDRRARGRTGAIGSRPDRYFVQRDPDVRPRRLTEDRRDRYRSRPSTSYRNDRDRRYEPKYHRYSSASSFTSSSSSSSSETDDSEREYERHQARKQDHSLRDGVRGQGRISRGRSSLTRGENSPPATRARDYRSRRSPNRYGRSGSRSPARHRSPSRERGRPSSKRKYCRERRSDSGSESEYRRVRSSPRRGASSTSRSRTRSPSSSGSETSHRRDRRMRPSRKRRGH